MSRAVFYVSDGTGITAETIGHTILTQFEGVRFETFRIPFIDSPEQARMAVAKIEAHAAMSDGRPILISSVIDPAITAILAESGGLLLDVFAPFISPLEHELGTQRSLRVGQAHGLVDFAEYEARINATNYALSHDDGVDVNYADAEVVLVGVSRSGKTPTCLYLALHYGIRAANYPLTQEDLERQELPKRLLAYRNRLFGLTIDSQRLAQVRETRRPGSTYARLEQCRWEVAAAEKLMRVERIACVSTTHSSIEEIASKILNTLGINRHMF
jgi:[pyruvate, water dikinase]-phosphate phosphotransferase / [pyruvate, water dikinase] kinase